MNDFFETTYFTLLLANPVALLLIYAGRKRRWAAWFSRALLAVNTPVLLLLLLALAQESKAARTRSGGESGMIVGILVGALLPFLVEYLLVVSAWWHLHRPAPKQAETRAT